MEYIPLVVVFALLWAYATRRRMRRQERLRQRFIDKYGQEP